MFNHSFESRFLKAAETLKLSNTQLSIIRDRYLRIVNKAHHDYKRTWLLFVVLTNLITVGGVLIISFLGLEKVNIISTRASLAFYWTSFILSILVTISNKSLYSYNIPRKYILNGLVLDKYKSEGWTFIGGVDRYEKCQDMEERVKLFCSRVEKIKMKSMEIMTSIETSAIDKMSQEHGASKPTGTNLSPSTEVTIQPTPATSIIHVGHSERELKKYDSGYSYIGEFIETGPSITVEQTTDNTVLTVVRHHSSQDLNQHQIDQEHSDPSLVNP
jgi:hypothetical protein